MEAISRGVLDTPLEPVIGLAEGETRWRGMTANRAPDVRIFSPLWHFPLSRKRFMVPSDFADGRCKSMINIKGLVVSPSLWRAV
jgi:hypothetical protein